MQVSHVQEIHVIQISAKASSIQTDTLSQLR